jgi:glycosyltransferase involved in cell wall biosynthesis/translation initiation factor 2B subunit (eIF-2B alpha/beta/delta family)
MYSLITYATEWGYSHGGINSFNTDLLSAFGYAYPEGLQVICIVSKASEEEILNAKQANVIVIPLPKATENKIFSIEDAIAGIAELKRRNIVFTPLKTIWLGHDLITGLAATYSSKSTGSKSALLHHMSYNHYESYAESSSIAKLKISEQKNLFDIADIVLAVGPLLRDSIKDLLGPTKTVHMVIPGLADIDSNPPPINFTAFLSGRLEDKSARIKQGHLGVAAFAVAHKNAKKQEFPTNLRSKPKLILRGVDFDSTLTNLGNTGDPETELKEFAYQHAQCVINIHALPYTKNRQELFNELSTSTLAMMPSWHEGFGLVGWEAIAAGVPLIITRDSGVYQLLDEEYPGAGPGCIYHMDVAGQVTSPYFNSDDLETVSGHIRSIAVDGTKAKRQALILRKMLESYTWTACAESLIQILGWDLNKITIPTIKHVKTSTANENENINSSSVQLKTSLLQIPDTKSVGKLTISHLLRAEEALVPFEQSREPDLEALKEWLEATDYLHSVRLITGDGGSGKTRLALELCNKLPNSEWHSGFLSNAIELSSSSNVWDELLNLNKNLLIVIDYAETRQTILLSLISAIIQKKSEKQVRILLLARDGGEWWETLPNKESICTEFLSGYSTTGPYRLKPLYKDLASRIAGYQNALMAFANYLNIAVPNVIPDLSGEHFNNPLYIQMSALLALLGDKQSTTQGLTRAILQHERSYWLKSVSEFYEPGLDICIEQLLALTTLAGGFQTAELAFRYWNKVNENSIKLEVFTKLYQSMQSLYPGKGGIEPVRPDLLGEALVVNALISTYASKLLDATLSNSAEKTVRLHSLTVLARISLSNLVPSDILVKNFSKHLVACCVDLVSVCSETQSNLPLIAKNAFESLVPNLKSQVFNLIEADFTNDSSELNEFYCAVSNYNCARLRLKHFKKPKNRNYLANYSYALVTFSSSLSNLGRYSDAIEVSLEAATILDRLNREYPQEYQEDLATALSNYASHLNDAGQNKAALNYAKKGLDIRESLSKTSDGVKLSLAISYSNYANFLNEDGKSKDAIRYSKLALDIRTQLLEDSDLSKSQLANSLNNYSSHLSEDGDTENAIGYAKSALEMIQKLAFDKPDLYEPDLAMALNNYANRLIAHGNFKGAIEYSKESIEIQQRLTNKNPDRYEHDFARTLSNHASHLKDNGDFKRALELAKQALEIRERLTKENPDRHEPDFATSLSNYASHLHDCCDFKGALEFAKQALEIRERLTKENPDRHEPDFATSLSNYASHLCDNGNFRDALLFTKQALEIRERLIKENPDRHEPDLATSLSNYASHLSENGCYKNAVTIGKQALIVIQKLAKEVPNRYETDFANFLSVYSTILSKNGEVNEAIKLTEQALDIQQRLAKDHPERYEFDLAKTLNDHANHLCKDGKTKDAIKLSEQALEIYQRLAKDHPERYEFDLAKTLNDHANHLCKDGKTKDAIKLSEQALEIYQRLAKDHPERYELDLIKTLNDYQNLKMSNINTL